MAKSVNYHNVTFLPENKIIQVAHLTSIFETIQVHNPIFESADELNPHNIELKFSCGAEGICRKCKIRAFEKMGPLTPTELGCLTEEELAKGIRLACQARVIQDTRVEIIYKLPFTIRLVDEPVGEHVELNPRIVKEFVSVPESGKPLREALLAAISAHSGRGSGSEIEPARLEAELARRFAVHFQKDHTEATAVCIEGRLVCLEEGDTSRSCYAVAVDLGTNTIVASLVDLVSGNKIAVVTDANPQIELGHDFESRIEMVAEDDLNLEILNEEILLRIDILIQELCRVRDISPLHVYEIAVSGSTGMLHLFLTGAPGLLEQHADGRYQAKQLEIHAPEQAAVYAMPVLSTFAGADITAGI
ncbi:MAG: 2Fe-2S iron-sulfur cluster binding domain-containing protein, partial [Deltaproteobacteria bacterium]|nr:2Fe-2S iron-sulfur cluster binding domain-containing protein [Deltaproteobacteria bacterium]